MKKHLDILLSPFRCSINDSSSAGFLLMGATVVSLLLANSAMGAAYSGFWMHEIHLFEKLKLPANLVEWINNFGMAFFFLLAGAEIKSELINGELSTFKKAILPVGAAIGGIIFPALIFIAFNRHSGYINGWAIPVATDIAFSLGVLSLLGKRIPLTLKTFLIALAIIDDLGAIIIIAFFYGGTIHALFLIAAAVIYAILLLLNYLNVRFGVVQIVLAIGLWYVLLNSGIEASIAGVLIAFAIPFRQLHSVEKSMHHLVNFIIIPFFVLANTAILLPTNILQSLSTPLALGIVLGLIAGKPLGIYLMSRLLVMLNIAELPNALKWKQVFGMGILAGIGFTMSFFITILAFKNQALQNIAKVAVLVSLLISVIAGVVYFYLIRESDTAKAKDQ